MRLKPSQKKIPPAQTLTDMEAPRAGNAEEAFLKNLVSDPHQHGPIALLEGTTDKMISGIGYIGGLIERGAETPATNLKGHPVLWLHSFLTFDSPIRVSDLRGQGPKTGRPAFWTKAPDDLDPCPVRLYRRVTDPESRLQSCFPALMQSPAGGCGNLRLIPESELTAPYRPYPYRPLQLSQEDTIFLSSVKGKLKAVPAGSPAVSGVLELPLEGSGTTCVKELLEGKEKLTVISSTVTKRPLFAVSPSQRVGPGLLGWVVPKGGAARLGVKACPEWSALWPLYAPSKKSNQPSRNKKRKLGAGEGGATTL